MPEEKKECLRKRKCEKNVKSEKSREIRLLKPEILPIL